MSTSKGPFSVWGGGETLIVVDLEEAKLHRGHGIAIRVAVAHVVGQATYEAEGHALLGDVGFQGSEH